MQRDDRKNVEINVGKACNNKCVFCVDGLPKVEDRHYLDLDAARAELRRWYDEGYRSLGWLGGEPTTWPSLLPATACARDLGFSRIAVATNATRLRKPEFARALVDAGLTRVTVSMHGHNAALEDRLTGVPGNFAKKRRALDNLVALRREGALPDGLSVNIVLNGRNHGALPRLLRFFFEEVGVDDVRANFIRPEGRAEGDRSLTPPFSAVVPSLVRAVVLNERHFRRVFTFGSVPLCVLPAPLRRDRALLERSMGELRDLATSCSIRSEGGDVVAPAAPWRERNSVVDFDPIAGRARFDWKARKRQDLKVRPPPCTTCTAGDLCDGVWKGWFDLWGAGELHALGPDDFAAALPGQ